MHGTRAKPADAREDRAGGYYRARGGTSNEQGLWRGVLEEAVPASVPIIAFLVMAGRYREHGSEIP